MASYKSTRPTRALKEMLLLDVLFTTDRDWTYKFFLAQTTNTTAYEEAQAENSKHKDIIFCDFMDSYQNVSLKTMAIAR